ncbi:hypothetical protein CBW16_00005 [Flavobacteriaceae bacterium JJC]|nr:hypothetical protein CBW16_00005 [Flavobacteriaceae bacterium JJC]
MKKIVLIFNIFLLLSCNKKNADMIVLNHEDSARIERNEEDEKQNQLIKKRRLDDANSINYTSRKSIFIRPTIDLTVQDFYNFKKSDKLEIEDYLIRKNWIFKSKKEKESVSGYNHKKIIYTYKNFSNDTEFQIFEDYDAENDELLGHFFKLYTLNPFNYKIIINELNDLDFSSNIGFVKDDSFTEKKHVGEIKKNI